MHSELPTQPNKMICDKQVSISVEYYTDSKDYADELQSQVEIIKVDFSKKIFKIIAVQLIITAIWASIVTRADYIRKLGMEDRVYNTFVCTGLILTGLVIVAHTGSKTNKKLLNYLLLFVFTMFEGALVGIIISYYPDKEVKIGSAMCIILCTVLVVFARCTKVDFTVLGMFIYAFLILLIAFRIILTFIVSDALFMLYCILGESIFSAYIVISVQMIIGNCEQKISEEHQTLIALALYIIIIDLYLFILQTIDVFRWY